MDLLTEGEVTKVNWSNICEKFPVPKSLYRHQIDTMTLLLRGENVFCGSPTGSGKTLAQLATILFTSGNTKMFLMLNLSFTVFDSGTALVIPPLQTIESQMCQVCEDWRISYLNLSSISEAVIGEEIVARKPQILIASIEKISDPNVQKQFANLKLEYIAVDEAQVIIKVRLRLVYIYYLCNILKYLGKTILLPFGDIFDALKKLCMNQ